MAKHCISIAVYCAALFGLWCTTGCTAAFAQVYVDGGNTRYRFAQMYLGAEALYQPGLAGTTQFLSESGNLQTISMQDRIAPRLTIGGMHFWGHADFYVTFGILPQISETSGLRYGYQIGTETGARVYPWRVERNALRPFLGVAWSAGSYSQANLGEGEKGQGASHRFDRAIMQVGACYHVGDIIVEGGMKWIPDNTIDYWISRNQTTTVSVPQAAFWLGAKYVFDTTIGEEFRSQKFPEYLSKREELYRKENRLNSWTIAAGPSSGTAFHASPYNQEQRPFVNPVFSANTLALDCSIGYYLYDLDAQFNLSYRPLIGRQRALGIRQEVHRHAFSFEAFKMIGDYHGFVPFVGATMGYELLGYYEFDNDVETVRQQEGKWLLGIIFGWDIRPTKTDAWLLRTNLRYTPGARLNVQGKDVALPNFEFNFIQFVLYFNRFFQ